MFDIHTHILPFVDDGSGSWEETLAMIRSGIKDGIRGAVCTSHVFKVLNEELEQKLTDRFNKLKKKLKQENINFNIWLGSEINVNAKFDIESSIATINGDSKYILLELPMSDYPHHVDDLLFQLSLKGLTPILAHPERNTVIMMKPAIVENLIERGVLIQINSGSLTGIFGRRVKKISMDLIKKGQVHIVASDCHNVNSRPMNLSGAYEIVENMYGKERTELLFTINPSKVIKGETISAELIHGEIKKKGWENYLHKIAKGFKRGG